MDYNDFSIPIYDGLYDQFVTKLSIDLSNNNLVNIKLKYSFQSCHD
jgi:hypothetical protein